MELKLAIGSVQRTSLRICADGWRVDNAFTGDCLEDTGFTDIQGCVVVLSRSRSISRTGHEPDPDLDGFTVSSHLSFDDVVKSVSQLRDKQISGKDIWKSHSVIFVYQI
ncbi:hypothetical protein DPX16_1016 [Anabarilius grahami]|uniref:Uncharacterized protein n=1 Tax=Anabarilius grahami TaxID=495550 RepID=A0A3N0Y760_ANAGA|nr:hypothetical protein DPX16_1016 [Anabarilius grahami]